MEALQSLAQRMDINAQNRFGTTALHVAAFIGWWEGVEFLVSKGAVRMPNAFNKTPEQLAEEKGHFRLAGYVRKMAPSADPNQ